MSYILKNITTLQKVRGDRVIGYDDTQDIYSVMMWSGAKWITIPGNFEFRPTHWYALPIPKN